MEEIINKYQDLISHFFMMEPNLILSIGIIEKGKKKQIILKHNEHVSTQYNYPIGSITKLFTASVIAKLVNEGKIHLDDSIAQYLSLENGDYPTIRELSSHTSGYKKFVPFFKIMSSLILHGYLKKNPYEYISKEDVFTLIKPQKRKQNRYVYSDFNFAVLGLVIEKVTNKPYEEVIANYCQELNLFNTHVMINPIIPLDGYYKKKNYKYWNWHDDCGFLSAGGISSTIQDLLAYCSFHLDPSKDFQLTQEKNAQIKYGRKKIPMHVGLAWHMYPNGNYLWHRGGVGCHRIAIALNKKKKFAVVIMANSKGNKTVNSHVLCTKLYNHLKRRNIVAPNK